MLNTFQQIRHDMLPTPTPQEASRQEFAKSLKHFVQKGLLPGLGPIFEGRAAPSYSKETGKVPANRHDIRKAMVTDPYFRHYAAVNRISQEMLWDSVIDSIEREQELLNKSASELSAKNAGQLVVPEDFVPPRYVSALDIHCMPGGYCGDEETGDDVSLGVLYDRGVYLYSMGYTGPFNDDMGRSVCNYLKRNMPDFKPKRILDMGCTVGHSTLPYKELFPDAEIWGIDVGEPMIRYAHARAGAMGLDVNYGVMNAEETTFEDESFDLVVSHILLHETSGKAMPRIFKECHRLLKPGGLMIHADLPPFDLMDPFTQFILDNETYYNNEPFWGAMRDLDQIKLAKDAGFPADAIKFDTAPMAVMEFAAASQGGYNEQTASGVADRDFTAGEFAPGGGWEVLIAQKAG
ncbi:class I SAM-dependent methyltransferase [Croceicoccus gelatinilyticus]|uniref:class I SAM-dependent methyltransferase n=1 Tax=Croceicoccus gelatinilyticus TaxID=2835536 RepID=UPI001BD04AF1|nr:class I SAM-dependent methyltransferase [Croceicoccus gelatinilyticus]MBS7669024.1 class I SAM-dependent methyltransferase [Croceicoccus gelatinilyticus]